MSSASNTTDAAVITAFVAIPALLEQTPALIARGRFLDCECLLGPTNHPSRLDPCRPHHRTDAGAGADAVLAFLYRATPAAWAEYWQAAPKPGWHDLLALTKRGEAMLEGDLHPFMAHLQYFKGLAGTAAASFCDDPIMSVHLEPIIGRYVHVDIGGEMHRIYFEENGAGIPLVCLHTAGSDGRQWRHLLADEEFAKKFRIIAFDMPWHGKSNPPRTGWNGEEYQLTTARYTQTVRAFCKALKLDKPVVMGCSIGGRIVLNLAIDHAAEFRALIGLEAADFQAPWYDTMAEPPRRPWRRSLRGAGVRPDRAAEPARRADGTLWAYKQGGPGVFKGDLYFYRVDGDLRGRVEAIDTKVCPLYLLTGEYDFSCTPEDTRRTAAAIGAPASPSWSSSVIFR